MAAERVLKKLFYIRIKAAKSPIEDDEGGANPYSHNVETAAQSSVDLVEAIRNGAATSTHLQLLPGM